MESLRVEKTDREIVEYLDESVVCWHEYTDDFGEMCIHCSMASEKNPTPTLEWMLEKLRKRKELLVMFDSSGDVVFDKTKDGCSCGILNREIPLCYRGVGDNETVALRGAVVRMILTQEEAHDKT